MQRFLPWPAVLVLVLAAPAVLAADAQQAPPALRDCDDCPEMVIVPAGTFVMGTPAADLSGVESPPETQPTVIRIAKPFAIGRFEVTRGEFAAFISASGRELRAGCRTWDATLGRFNDDGRRTWLDPGVPSEPTERHPVSCVSWADAQAYASWLSQKTGKSYRLPSAAEWEYAARAGTTTLRPWGDAAEEGCDNANTYDLGSRAVYQLGWPQAGCHDGYADVAPVGQFKANGFGLHDMIGNVWEWTADCSTGSNVGRPRDGSAWTWLGGCKRRVIRGGGWLTPPDRSRSGFHGDDEDTDRTDYVGFRVARDVDASREAR